VYNASGIVKRGFYPDEGSKLHPERCTPLGEYFVSGLSSSHIFARCPPTNPRGTEAQKKSNKQWDDADQEQARPFYIENRTKRYLPKWFCFPRCMILKAAYGTSRFTSDYMDLWLRHYNVPYSPHLNSGSQSPSSFLASFLRTNVEIPSRFTSPLRVMDAASSATRQSGRKDAGFTIDSSHFGSSTQRCRRCVHDQVSARRLPHRQEWRWLFQTLEKGGEMRISAFLLTFRDADNRSAGSQNSHTSTMVA